MKLFGSNSQNIEDAKEFFKNEMVLKNPIIIDSFAYRNPLRIYEILESIDQMSTDFFLENLEKLDEDENIGD